ncbi:flagellin [Clostridium senegalense]
MNIDGTNFKFDANTKVEDINKALKNAGINVELGVNAGGDKATLTSTIKGTSSNFEASVTVAGGAATDLTVASGQNANVTAADGTLKGASFTSQGDIITITSGDYKGLELKVESNVTAADSGNSINITGNGTLTLQIGANEGQTMGMSISDMRADALGVSGIDVSTSKAAQSATTTIQRAIDTVSSERSKLGAVQNRLEHTVNNLGTSSENLTAAESRIRDVDMAKEMMTFSKNNILQQAAQAMLAQANQQPQGVLQLLR